MLETRESEIVHVNLKGNNVPTFMLGGAQLVRAESFKYFGMLFTKHMNSFSSAEHMCAPFLAGCHRARRPACDYKLADQPHTMLWLTKACALPACICSSSMYVCLPNLGDQADRPHTMLWLTKACALPACMYATEKEQQ
eukprot:1144150-Pelagomonas_calceolata.AAC.1